MAKKMSKGGKTFLSIIFHLVVLIVMVNAYDAARALLKEKGAEKAAGDKSTKDKKGSAITPANKQPSITPISKPSKSSGKSPVKPYTDKLGETKGKMEERGTSMEDLMAEKERRAKEKAAQENKTPQEEKK